MQKVGPKNLSWQLNIKIIIIKKYNKTFFSSKTIFKLSCRVVYKKKNHYFMVISVLCILTLKMFDEVFQTSTYLEFEP